MSLSDAQFEQYQRDGYDVLESPVSKNEREALESLRTWADRVVELSETRGSAS